MRLGVADNHSHDDHHKGDSRSEKVTKPLTIEEKLSYIVDEPDFKTTGMDTATIVIDGTLDDPGEPVVVEDSIRIALEALERHYPLLVNGLRNILGRQLISLSLNRRKFIDTVMNELSLSVTTLEFTYKGGLGIALEEARAIAVTLSEILPRQSQVPLEIKIEQISGQILVRVGIIEG